MTMTILYKTTTLFPPVSTRESDTTLLEAAKQMDREALVQIFDTYSPAIYNYAFRLCNDALMADYIVGDVFAKLLEHLSAGRGPSSNLRSYLYEMTYHLVVDEARYSQRITQIENADLQLHDDSSPSISVEDRVLYRTVMRAIRNNLTVDQRHVIILRFLEGFSVHETAVIIGKEESNIKVIQNRAIAALRKALGFQGAQ
jgi:RNA polymerase sigma-70 factor, ECF subfamily